MTWVSKKIAPFSLALVIWAGSSAAMESPVYMDEWLARGVPLVELEPDYVSPSLEPHLQVIHQIIHDVLVVLEQPQRSLTNGAILLNDLLNVLKSTPGNALAGRLAALAARAREYRQNFNPSDFPRLTIAETQTRIDDLQVRGVQWPVIELLQRLALSEFDIEAFGCGVGGGVETAFSVDVTFGCANARTGGWYTYFGATLMKWWTVAATKIQFGRSRGTMRIQEDQAPGVAADNCGPLGLGCSGFVRPGYRTGQRMCSCGADLQILIWPFKRCFPDAFRTEYKEFPRLCCALPCRNYEPVMTLLGIQVEGMFDPEFLALAPILPGVVVAEEASKPGEVKMAEPQGPECVICREPFEDENQQTFTACAHGPYHQGCLNNWLVRSNDCPECRKSQPNSNNDVPNS